MKDHEDPARNALAARAIIEWLAGRWKMPGGPDRLPSPQRGREPPGGGQTPRADLPPSLAAFAGSPELTEFLGHSPFAAPPSAPPARDRLPELIEALVRRVVRAELERFLSLPPDQERAHDGPGVGPEGKGAAGQKRPGSDVGRPSP